MLNCKRTSRFFSLLIFTLATPALTCTTIVVGKKASADGSVMADLVPPSMSLIRSTFLKAI